MDLMLNPGEADLALHLVVGVVASVAVIAWGLFRRRRSGSADTE